MGRAQATFEKTGGLHAAGLFDADGRLIVLREDIGRHNAVDKVIGAHAAARRRLPLDRHILMVSGRASFEIMQKALTARNPGDRGGVGAVEPGRADGGRRRHDAGRLRAAGRFQYLRRRPARRRGCRGARVMQASHRAAPRGRFDRRDRQRSVLGRSIPGGLTMHQTDPTRLHQARSRRHRGRWRHLARLRPLGGGRGQAGASGSLGRRKSTRSARTARLAARSSPTPSRTPRGTPSCSRSRATPTARSTRVGSARRAPRPCSSRCRAAASTSRSTGRPGSDKWQEISWDQMLDRLAAAHQGVARRDLRDPGRQGQHGQPAARASRSPAAPRSAARRDTSPPS